MMGVLGSKRCSLLSTSPTFLFCYPLFSPAPLLSFHLLLNQFSAPPLFSSCTPFFLLSLVIPLAFTPSLLPLYSLPTSPPFHTAVLCQHHISISLPHLPTAPFPQTPPSTFILQYKMWVWRGGFKVRGTLGGIGVGCDGERKGA